MKKYLLAIGILIFIVNESVAQCCPDRHSTNAHDGWISCTPSQNPVAGLGNTHWIRYDFGQVHEMHQTTFWNLNDPDRLADNANYVRVHHSTDGQNWTYWGNINFVQATGDPKYEGFEGPNFNGIQARYLVLTALTNFGGSCSGFGEMRINTEPTTDQQFQISIDACINDGVFYGLDGGLAKDGAYAGTGVINSYEDKFDFDPDAAGPGLHTITYQYMDNGNLMTHTASINVKECGTSGCAPCPPCDQIFQPILDADPIQNGTFYVSPELNSVGTVNSNFDIDFRGGQAVLMKDGFEVQSDALFLAQIRKCDNIPTNNILVNGDFEDATLSPWSVELHETAAATMSIETNPVHVATGNASAKVVTTSTTDTGWHIQFKNTGSSLVANQQYILTFAAKADKNINVLTAVSRNNSPWNGYDDMVSGLTTEWQFFTLPVVPDEDNNGHLRVGFRLSDLPIGTYWFDNIVLIQQ